MELIHDRTRNECLFVLVVKW